jgi:hypothetical protein
MLPARRHFELRVTPLQLRFAESASVDTGLVSNPLQQFRTGDFRRQGIEIEQWHGRNFVVSAPLLPLFRHSEENA